MTQITIQNYHDCYDLGKKVAEGKMSIGMAMIKMEETGMNKRSAGDYLRCVRAMLLGEKYTSTVKKIATSYFLTEIYSEYGQEGLRKALKAVELHLEYQKGYNNQAAIKEVYNDFMEIL